MGWRIVDPLGNTYHHAVAAFLNIFGVKVHSLHNFSGIDQLFDMIPGKKSFLALSLDNRFILEQTLDSGEKELLKKLYPDFGVEKGRHVVLLDGFDSGSVSVVDPFQVLKDGEPNQRQANTSEIFNPRITQCSSSTNALPCRTSGRCHFCRTYGLYHAWPRRFWSDPCPWWR